MAGQPYHLRVQTSLEGQPSLTSAFAMSALDQVIEVATSVILLIVGLWGTAFAYGVVGPKLVGGLHWNERLQRPLRWLGPLLVFLCIASLVFLFR